MPTALDTVDRKLLNHLQSSFPLVDLPFSELGGRLEIPPAEVLSRIAELKADNVVRQISAIFDTRRLGYKTSLVACRYDPRELEAGARVVNEHPGVSHNYERNSEFNLWFTLAVPPDEDLAEAVTDLAGRSGAEQHRLLPTIKFFKIGVNFDMVTEEGAAEKYFSPDGYNGDRLSDWNKVEPVTEPDIEAIRELQEDLPLEERPFEPMAERLGVTQAGLFDIAADFERRGIMRRYSAVLHHRRAGFKSNGMGVWNVPEERSEEVGQVMAGSKWVTHCYERPTYDDWRFSHYTMIHATSPEKCEEVAGEISEATGITDYKMLYSTREYKKTRVRYFVQD